MESSQDHPFFLCLWHWAVHGPWQAKPELMDYFEKHPDPAGLQKSPLRVARKTI